MNKKIIMSLSVIAAVSAAVVGGTGAFFSDSETSTGNTFTAGSIDLSIGSQFSSNNNANGLPATQPLLADNNGRALYNFTDLKPGDFGSGSFDLSVTSNEAYACAMTQITSTPENTPIDPEIGSGDSAVLNGPNDGELQNFLQFAIFADQNGNGVRDPSEPLNVNQYGAGDGNGFTTTELGGAGWIAVADPTSPNTWLTIPSLAPSIPYHAGFMYCFGNFDANGVCGLDLLDNDNVAQTDSISGNLTFQAIQTRNNGNFTCASLNENENE